MTETDGFLHPRPGEADIEDIELERREKTSIFHLRRAKSVNELKT